MMKKFMFVLTSSILFALLLVVIVFLTGCISQPNKKDYEGRPNACYDFAACLYFNQKNPDKSICSDYAKECRAYERFNFCKDIKNLPEQMRFQEAWDKLNSK
jgi:ABC-type oligopeptide transport system substrate-binding subunit